MKFRSEIEVLRHATEIPAPPNVALSLDGDELIVEYRYSVKRTFLLAGVTPGLAVLNAQDLQIALDAMPPGAVQVEVVDDDLLVSGGRTQFRIGCLYSRDRP